MGILFEYEIVCTSLLWTKVKSASVTTKRSYVGYFQEVCGVASCHRSSLLDLRNRGNSNRAAGRDHLRVDCLQLVPQTWDGKTSHGLSDVRRRNMGRNRDYLNRLRRSR